MPQPQPQESFWMKPSEAFGMTTVAAQVLASFVTPVLHRGFGRDGLGLPGVIAWLLIPAWASFAESYLLLDYWKLWMAMVVARRIQSWWMHRRGYRVHSRYQGDPPFYRWLGEKARTLEALLLLALGWYLADDDRGLSRFAMAGGGALLYLQYVAALYVKRQQIELDNAALEAGHYGR